MSAKSILIKTRSKTVYQLLLKEIIESPKIKFFSKKINGIYTLTIKCNDYYSFLSLPTSKSIYGNYIFLYSSISIILSDILIKLYEFQIAKRFINSQYFYFPKTILNQLTNLSSLVLSDSLPDYSNNELYLFRRETLLHELLNNFQKRNYIFLDSFINFNTPYYHETLEYILSTSVELILSNQNLFH
ncbi:MAG: hypothetical protein J6B87_01595 [Clostridia bacterium]|nr:hypothetical protein [Clostridia bacterium]